MTPSISSAEHRRKEINWNATKLYWKKRKESQKHSDNQEKIDKEVLNTNEVGETINRVIVKINNVLRVTENHNVSQSQEVNSNSVNIATQLPSQQKIRARLSKLPLKRFSGKPTEWQSFWDS